MEDDDDTFLVVVGDVGWTFSLSKLENKEDLVDHEDNFSNHHPTPEDGAQGEIFKIELDSFKQEPDEEYLEESLDVDDSYYLNDISDEENYEIDIKPPKPYVDAIERRRYNGHGWVRKSFVKELQRKYPNLKKDKESLIRTLAETMRQVKAPELPQDYFFHNGTDYECSKCESIYATKSAVSRHYQEKHGIKYLICFACGVDFRSTTSLYKHEKACRAADAVTMLKARARVVGPKGRNRPYLLKQSKISKQKKVAKRFSCTQCSGTFSCRLALESHERLHRGERPYLCNECPLAYTSMRALQRHLEKHSGIQFTCDHCNRSFKTKGILIAHLDTHRPLKKYPCDECGRRFSQKTAMMLHFDKIHRNLPAPCACQICPSRYPRMSLLKQHMRRAHGLSLMTRKMFIRALPGLDATQIHDTSIKASKCVSEQAS